jgi:hypothetical protein
MDNTETERIIENRKMWEEYMKTHHLIRDDELQKLFNDESFKFELESGFKVAKIVHNELELKKLILRFGNWDKSTVPSSFNNLDVLEYFEGVIKGKTKNYKDEDGYDVEENPDLTKFGPCKVAYFNQFSRPPWAWDEAEFIGLREEDIEIDEGFEIEYPAVVRIWMEDGWDRGGNFKFRIVTCLSLNRLLYGDVIVSI